MKPGSRLLLQPYHRAGHTSSEILITMIKFEPCQFLLEYYLSITSKFFLVFATLSVAFYLIANVFSLFYKNLLFHPDFIPFRDLRTLL